MEKEQMKKHIHKWEEPSVVFHSHCLYECKCGSKIGLYEVLHILNVYERMKKVKYRKATPQEWVRGWAKNHPQYYIRTKGAKP